MDILPLASEFPTPSREDWLKLVSGVLKGAEFERKLVSRTYDGFEIQPLYEKAEGGKVAGRASHGVWRVMQRVEHPDPSQASEQARADLEGGAAGLILSLAGSLGGRGFGVQGSLAAALDGVMLDLIRLSVETAPFAGKAAADEIVRLARERGLACEALSVDFGLDPIGDMARTGRLPLPWEELARDCAGTVAFLRDAGFRSGLLRIDTRPYHEAGASEVQELAAALATGVAYLRALEASGIPFVDAQASLSFLAVADADQFLTIAKLRALRQLWARIEDECGLTPAPIHLQVETAWRMLTRRDPWVNLLRGTIAAFSAAVGGADDINVLPFTAALGLADPFARRIARNTQLVLADEANLWRVADPAAGSGAFEALTDDLCSGAWTLFREIEASGGIVASLQAGRIQEAIAGVRSKRNRAVASRRDPLTGTSEFPNIHETPVAVLAPSPALRPDPAPDFPALPSRRTAEPFEHLRDRSDDALARAGRRPRVFLANLGPVAAFTARATFAKNLFEAGGIEAIPNDGFPDHGAMAAAFRYSGAPLACLCSSDEIYESDAEAAARALHAAHPGATLYLAGRPGPHEAALRDAGISGFVFAGCDALGVLDAALSQAEA
ncbi:methylmalonyl-CoA mutase subunit beta [Microvirga massiliensis]|uniref:methylmalonyl-CoA mutase subunit beta n=1 Tax=Microvirga massiliensis TaxID=1033741 RepID=UPI00062BE535|nr:methylmalonyl-CoA mutase subunit beta [Microvirga massiliensis]